MKTLKIATVGLIACAAVWPGPPAGAQQAGGVVAAALRVLMIAAHPDDEDTGLLTALARGMGAETAYLSLSRGEGGQNLIGPRLHEGLGVIRTGELLAARALDGGKQFFTRAFDFGYSKSIDEALGLWPLEDVLRDAVYVVRSFRPHVIVAVFSGTARDGHGQHQVAGVVAHDVFAAAGDPDRYPGDYGTITEIAAPFVARASSSCATHATGRSPASGRSTAASTPTLSSSSTTTCPRHARAVPPPRSCSKSP